jgi:LCP family protein required for cell wall assembly
MDLNRRGLRERLNELAKYEVKSSVDDKKFSQTQNRKRKVVFISISLICVFVLPMVLGIWHGWHSAERKRKSLMRHLAGAFCRLVMPPEVLFAGKDRVNILLIGRDRDYDRHGRILNTHGRADTIIVVSLCRSERKVSILSIPRDTAVIINGHGLHKINAAHSFGGPEKLIEVLQDQLCIHIDYYARTSFEGFKKIVDAIGGVWLYVEKDMNYDDNWGNLHIHLKKGWQWLDGDKAHQYVRFRHDAEGDIGRTRRQRKFLEALAARLTSPAMLPRLPSLILSLYKYVDTNMTIKELMSLAGFAEQVDVSQIETETLPGRPVSHYWFPDREKAAEVLERMLGETFGRYLWDLKISAIEEAIGMRAVRRPQKKALVVRKRKRYREEVPEEMSHELPQVPEMVLPTVSTPRESPKEEPSEQMQNGGGSKSEVEKMMRSPAPPRLVPQEEVEPYGKT